MKTIFIIVLVFVSFFAFGQSMENIVPKIGGGSILIGVNFSPDYCFRTVKSNSNNIYDQYFVNYANENEMPKLGYTTGINICFKRSNKFEIETGLQFSNKGYSTKEFTGLTYGDMIDPRFGFIYATQLYDAPISIKFRINDLYLDVPFRVAVKYGTHKLKFIGGIGITTNIFLKLTQTAIIQYESGKQTRKTSDYNNTSINKIGFSATASIGVEYQAEKKIVLRAEPTFRYGLMKLYDSAVSTNLWNAGLNVGCYYVLK